MSSALPDFLSRDYVMEAPHWSLLHMSQPAGGGYEKGRQAGDGVQSRVRPAELSSLCKIRCGGFDLKPSRCVAPELTSQRGLWGGCKKRRDTCHLQRLRAAILPSLAKRVAASVYEWLLFKTRIECRQPRGAGRPPADVSGCGATRPLPMPRTVAGGVALERKLGGLRKQTKLSTS